MSAEPDPPGPRKRSPEELAVLGGAPTFAELRHVGRPNIGDRARFQERIDRMLDARWLTNGGPMTLELEARLRELTGARHAVAVANATVGLEIAAMAAGLTGEVLVPAFTFVATPHALRWVGLQPVFCDADPVTLTIDPDEVERRIGPRTSAIVGVHVYGRLCDTERLEAIAARHGIPVLYDAAHALGCSRGGRRAGTFGAAEVFSFHATKFVNAFEGGAIVTDDDGIAERSVLMRNFGIADYERTASIGTNGKMSEVSAAMGLTSLDAMADFLRVNRAHAIRYAAGLMDIPGIRFLGFERLDETNAQYAVLRVDAAAAGIDRDGLQQVLAAEGVLARRYFAPGCHRLEPYASEQPDLVLPVTDRAAAEVLSLPTGTGVSAADVDAIIALVRFAVTHAEDLRHVLGRGAGA